MRQNNMLKEFSRPLAVLALAGLAACTGGPTAPTPPAPFVQIPAGGATLVGIGDSLTAGVQANNLLGAPNVTSPVSGYPGGLVPPGQESGFFALMFDQMNGGNPAASQAVLPLIGGPGLGSQIVIGTSAATLLTTTHSSCDAFNVAGFSPTKWTSTRLNPAAATLNLGIPGLTMHEAVAMHAPLTGPPTGASCSFVTIPNDPTSGGLQSLVAGESGAFYPVLGNFQAGLGNNLTPLNAAVALKPSLTTVFVGSNDVIKFAFAAGKSPITDTPQQLGADLTQIVKSLTSAGSKVLVADLPNVLGSPQFFPQTKLAADLQALGIPALAAGAIVNFVGTQYGVTAGGYLTESAFLAIVQGCQVAPATCVTPILDPNGPGSGLGGAYLTPAFAQQIAGLNAAYNQVIDQIASSSGKNVALVPINALFSQAAATGVPVPGFPNMTLQFGGGLVSWDGFHPSNIGYATIANAFIQTADAAFNAGIPPIPAAAFTQIATTDPYNSFAIKSVNPAFPFPLP
jgi:lysophospholipase L1-like esterase